jgi:hypothetical protein
VELFLLPALPLLGVALAGKPLGRYMEFPPRTHYVEHAGFSWPVFAGLGAFILAVVLPFSVRIVRSRRGVAREPRAPARRFPWWGWAGLAFGACAWVLAWSRFAWFAPFQPFTFSPLWFAYIAVINALTFRRVGRCMLLDRPGYFLRLLALSAGFWWFFEYLNRFVQNWHYVGIGGLTAWQYFLYATLPFATVLPAVLGTYEWLSTFPATAAGLHDFIRIRPRHPRLTGGVVLLVAAFGLAGIGVWPDYLFPLLWLSPLLILAAGHALRGEAHVCSPIASGDWHGVVRLALAALICGLFWEMWNDRSLAKWIYTVPFVNRFRLFEMPLLGYAGYLPFGLECALLADLRDRSQGPPEPESCANVAQDSPEGP